MPRISMTDSSLHPPAADGMSRACGLAACEERCSITFLEVHDRAMLDPRYTAINTQAALTAKPVSTVMSSSPARSPPGSPDRAR